MANEVDLKELVDALTDRVKALEEKADGFSEGHHALDTGNAAMEVALDHVREKVSDTKDEVKILGGKFETLNQRVHDLQWRHMWVPLSLMAGLVITIAIFFVSYTNDAVNDVEQKVIELRQEIKKDR